MVRLSSGKNIKKNGSDEPSRNVCMSVSARQEGLLLP